MNLKEKNNIQVQRQTCEAEDDKKERKSKARQDSKISLHKMW
jgi:hypothetical protein